MKTLAIRKDIGAFYLITMMMTAAVVVFGAAASAQAAFTVNSVNDETSGCTTLYAGQTIEAGTVCWDVVGENLEVTYSTNPGWQLEETHLWVGCGSEGYPQGRNGNPKIGQFPYNSGDITGETYHTEVIILAQFPCLSAPDCDNGNLLYSMAHAALRLVDGSGNVIQTETGWAFGEPSGAKNWSTTATINLLDDTCVGGPGGDKCYRDETAFAYDEFYATCFSELGELVTNPSRWGWSNGPYAPGETVTFDVFAGAGSGGSADCVITNEDGSPRATNVGTATLIYDGSTATVEYNLTGGWIFEKTHVYVGNVELASGPNGSTLAPGQYGSTNDFDKENAITSSTHVITGLSGNVYVVLHAAVLLEIPCEY